MSFDFRINIDLIIQYIISINNLIELIDSF